jgi:hypothetical protein
LKAQSSRGIDRGEYGPGEIDDDEDVDGRKNISGSSVQGLIESATRSFDISTLDAKMVQLVKD